MSSLFQRIIQSFDGNVPNQGESIEVYAPELKVGDKVVIAGDADAVPATVTKKIKVEAKVVKHDRATGERADEVRNVGKGYRDVKVD